VGRVREGSGERGGGERTAARVSDAEDAKPAHVAEAEGDEPVSGCGWDRVSTKHGAQRRRGRRREREEGGKGRGKGVWRQMTSIHTASMQHCVKQAENLATSAHGPRYSHGLEYTPSQQPSPPSPPAEDWPCRSARACAFAGPRVRAGGAVGWAGAADDGYDRGCKSPPARLPASFALRRNSADGYAAAGLSTEV